VIRLQRTKGSDEVKVTFVVDGGVAEGHVAVVGDFNGWSPYAHVLRKRSNGTRSVAVTVPAGRPVHFRYLTEDGRWFDDPQASEHTPEGGILHV
jgi:1,4-alpha-glucan branching enzyme